VCLGVPPAPSAAPSEEALPLQAEPRAGFFCGTPLIYYAII
jgi:hypothetical protein